MHQVTTGYMKHIEPKDHFQRTFALAELDHILSLRLNAFICEGLFLFQSGHTANCDHHEEAEVREAHVCKKKH